MENNKQYDNTNSGFLMRNQRKEKETHADMTGSINVNGVEYWLSGWTKTKTDGSGKFLSLSVQPKQQMTTAKSAPKRQSRVEDMDSDIPFN